MPVDPSRIMNHYQEQDEQLVRAIALTTPATLTTCPVEFAMVHGLPIWAVKEVMRQKGVAYHPPATISVAPLTSGESRRVVVRGSTLWPERIGQVGQVCPVPIGAGVSMIKVVFDDGDYAYFRDDEIHESD